MLTVETRPAISPTEAKGMDTTALRGAFLGEGLFAPGEIRLIYSHYDRMITGGAVPAGGSLTLDQVKECGTASVLDRRELGVVNVGAAGSVTAAGQTYAMEKGDVLYLGRGLGPVSFAGQGRFYLTSAPAHASLPARLIRLGEAKSFTTGAPETANHRTIYQFIHPEVMESCQLVLGYTKFHGGSVWNTMPAHLHDRRMEAYFYFDLAPDARVFHMMGRPEETRHLVVANEEAVLSPPWSIHCGAGTGSYTFVWAMAGDNVDYKDVEMVGMGDLR
ncbi:5-dehydro-4-deoxy-D-glucuronate isomerase [Tabrizicola sp.]|uniref:5-dehydro-4-deoxy-D-glucuronate isomerase n=1 Tax=Tabrizicola sp. TaxID=2005166 RepID=UPI00260A6050|nr:5-dehydro-4-deoxy-D-glucuronate isomerase [Tabrizicola sp.]MDM7933589.1 5-dehydro-4-deoxy-D-glucuronate isomerase [Tabrizicola sp.]